MMCDDDAMLIPYQIGDVFISHSQEETQELLEAAKVMTPWPLSKTRVIQINSKLSFRMNWIRKKDFISQTYVTGFQIVSQEALQDEIKALEGRVSSIKDVLGDLKVQLYAKFGNNINLEADESWNFKHVDLNCGLLNSNRTFP